jgi:hypothetical protein
MGSHPSEIQRIMISLVAWSWTIYVRFHHRLDRQSKPVNLRHLAKHLTATRKRRKEQEAFTFSIATPAHVTTGNVIPNMSTHARLQAPSLQRRRGSHRHKGIFHCHGFTFISTTALVSDTVFNQTRLEITYDRRI